MAETNQIDLFDKSVPPPPEGFVLDTPVREPVSPTGLPEEIPPPPEGFVLDGPRPDTPKEEPPLNLLSDMEKYGRDLDMGLHAVRPEKIPSWEEVGKTLPEDLMVYGDEVKNALSISATYNVPLRDAFEMEPEYAKQLGEASLYEKAAASFESGIGDVYVTMGSTMKWLGFSDEAADVYGNFGENMRLAYIPPTDQSEFTWGKMIDPEWLATTGVRAVPFTLSLIPAAVVGAYGGATAAGAAGLGTFGSLVLGSLGATALSRPIESAFEAGGIRDEALARGMSEFEANKAADEVFFGNLSLAGLDAAQLALAFAPFPKFGGAAGKRLLALRAGAVTGKLIGVGITEAGEERYQSVIGMRALGDETSFFANDPRLNEASALGFTFGVGMGGAGSVWTAFRNEVVDNMPEEIKAPFDETKNALIEAGATDEEAELQALDAVAETPEGETYIKETMETLKAKTAEIQSRALIAREEVARIEEEGEIAPIEEVVEATEKQIGTLQADIDFAELQPEIFENEAELNDFVALQQEALTTAKASLAELKASPEFISVQEERARVAAQTPEGQIVENITTQLEATGMEPEAARLQAETLFGEPFRLLAERAGLTPSELFEQFGPTITGEGVDEDGVTYNQEGQVKTETPEFKEWFGDSKVVDEDGEPLAMYHGTPDAGFDAFKEDQFFTSDKNYAERFLSSSTASSSFQGIETVDPKIFEVYIKSENPFDTRKPEHAKILREKYAKIFGEGVLTERGLPDWVEGRDIAEFLRNELPEQKFDSIIVDEGKDALGQRPESMIVFEPTQIKSTQAQAFDPTDPRILFQAEKGIDTLADFVRESGGLSTEGEELKGDITSRFSIKEGFNLVNNKTGLSVDDMAELAFESGYFAERPTPAEFIDSLSQDVDFKTSGTGSPIFSAEDADAAAEAQIEAEVAKRFEPRAKITFGEKGTLIELLENADPSSFIHETGHLYLQMLDNLVTRPGVSQDLIDDHNVILDWLGTEAGKPLTVSQQEQWARGFEAYLREGKAPTSALKEAFIRFKEWLTAVYETARELNVQLTPEVRSVMDRLLATREDLANILTDADNAMVDLVTEGQSPAKITDKEIKEIVPRYRPVPASKVKGIVRRAAGVKQTFKLISEDKVLKATWKKAEQAARTAFRAGEKSATEKAKTQMRDVIKRAKQKAHDKDIKAHTEKSKLQKRRRTINTIINYLNLTGAQVKKLMKRRDFTLMTDYEFKVFKDNMLLEAEKMQTTALAKARVSEVIQRKRLEKTENYRKALQLPTLQNMNEKQLDEFAVRLDAFQEGDVFLTERELELVDRTDLAGIRTWREARVRLAEEAGVPVEELAKVTVSEFDDYRWDTSLAERNPFYKLLVEETTRNLMIGEAEFHDIENEVFALAKASEASRGRTLLERAIPQDKQIIEYLESPADERSEAAEDMTPEQIDLAHYMQEYFGEALEYLIQVKALERGRENYFTHIRRTVLEDIKEDGIIKAVTNLFKNYQEEEMVFNILDEDTGNILPLEKFFQFSMRRTGTVAPTYNVVKAFLAYAKTLEKKKSLDAIIPKLDIYAQSLTPKDLTQRGLEVDRSVKKFVNKYINNKKGRQIRWVAKQGGKVDLTIRALRTFVALHDLGFNLFVGTASIVGEQVTNFEMLGVKKYTLGKTRRFTKKGQAILKKYEAFTGRSLWQEFTAPGKEITERVLEGAFGLFHQSAVVANGDFLLGMLTKEEFDSGELSDERLALLKIEMGRFRVVQGTKSLVGTTSAGGSGTQYKSWAIVIARTLSKDVKTLIADLKAKPPGEALTTREAREIYRMISLTSGMLIIFSLGAEEEDDGGFSSKLSQKVHRESLTLMQGVDPKLLLSTPRILIWLAKLGQNLQSLILLEEYDEKPGYKGAEGLKKQFTPVVIQNLIPKEGD